MLAMCSGYGKMSRAQAPDKYGLSLHYKFLKIWLKYCPKGFPKTKGAPPLVLYDCVWEGVSGEEG